MFVQFKPGVDPNISKGFFPQVKQNRLRLGIFLIISVITGDIALRKPRWDIAHTTLFKYLTFCRSFLLFCSSTNLGSRCR